MKTLVYKVTQISLYLFSDDTPVFINESNIVVGSPAEFIIDDLSDRNADLVNDVTPPEDWVGEKYLYVNSEWKLNPYYVPPLLPTDDLIAAGVRHV